MVTGTAKTAKKVKSLMSHFWEPNEGKFLHFWEFNEGKFLRSFRFANGSQNVGAYKNFDLDYEEDTEWIHAAFPRCIGLRGMQYHPKREARMCTKLWNVDHSS